ncbi:Bardet-Biedl syndrome 2 protein homolog [Frankliniella occidentalis]|uniref:Bardet-Biedl syndrome 2 protein homolog n=1 Tax=Frankliniella occidentalis TaxID=133901 RepID=A0A6J1SF31_FRAOC|nr:Bardet-Biedl syndrome 2 protein homolog [Frankliniella occidentalis]
MAVPVFTLQLNCKILPGRVTIGKYDGSHSCLTAATTADKVLIHSPHRRLGPASQITGATTWSQVNKEISLLSVNRNVSALAAGRLHPELEQDILIVGTQSSVLAYNVESNKDLFYKEVADGANVIVVGNLSGYENPLALVGGNCSIQGFDYKGNDPYWTVSGDNVRSLALLDYDLDGENELIVGSDDFDLRVFKEDVMVGETSETEVATILAPLRGSKMAYALANGTVGVYNKLHRVWRVKSKNRAVSVLSYDIDGDGVEELVTGWSNGKVDARNSRTGEVVFKDNFNCSIAGLADGDYRLEGRSQLICCSVDGEVRGYDSSRLGTLIEGNVHQDAVRDLLQKKQALLMELRNYESNTRSSGNAVGQANMNAGMIPAKTSLQTTVSINMGNKSKGPHVELCLTTNNETIIRAVLVFAEGIFAGETHVVHPHDDELSSSLRVALFPPRDVPLDIHIKALVGLPRTEQFHVFELTRHLPRFAMYTLMSATAPLSQDQPHNFVSFFISERVQRVILWINQNFLLSSELEQEASGGSLSVSFTALRDGSLLNISMHPAGRVVISTPNMTLAGDLVQSLASFLNLSNLQVIAEFPDELAHLGEWLEKVSNLQEVRIQLGADLAHRAGLVRNLIVRAEDARLLPDLKSMRDWHSQLKEVNDDLINSYNIRCSNHNELLDILKQINLTIQKAARLRVGQSKADVVNLSRSALQSNNLHSLMKIVRTGEA